MHLGISSHCYETPYLIRTVEGLKTPADLVAYVAERNEEAGELLAPRAHADAFQARGESGANRARI